MSSNSSMAANSTMRALAKTKPAPGLELIEAPIPEPGPEDVLIRVKKTAICGADIHIWNWDEWAVDRAIAAFRRAHNRVGGQA